VVGTRRTICERADEGASRIVRSSSRALPHTLLRLQTQAGNAAVTGLLQRGRGTEPAVGEKGARPTHIGAITSGASPPLSVQLRNGFRPPPRPARRPGAANRGRLGQLPGQHLPPVTPRVRREARERRDQQRLEEARRQFVEQVTRSREFIQRWGREGSEPKTAGQRAFRVLVKVLELWDEVSSARADTYTAFREMMTLRGNMMAQHPGAAEGSRRTDEQIVRLWNDLGAVDHDLVDRVVGWHLRLRAALDEFAWTNPAGYMSTGLKLIALFIEFVNTSGEVKARLREIRLEVLTIETGYRMMNMSSRWHSPTSSVRPVD
jgi:hypothetical protein